MRIDRLAALLASLLLWTTPEAAAESASAEALVNPPRKLGERNGVPVYRKEILSEVYTIDRIYRSMRGPRSLLRLVLNENAAEPELLWAIAYRAVITAADGVSELSPEFMCHSNMDVVPKQYYERFPTQLLVTGNRLFTLDQGTLSLELPPGFGIPIMSNHELLFNPQVLNHNVVGETFQVRQKVYIDFIRDADLPEPLIPLIQHGAYVMALLEGPDGHFGVSPDEVDEAKHGPGCSLEIDASHDRRLLGHDAYGRRVSPHWVVKPGRHAYHTRVTSILKLPYDTTMHYASSHLHPFAESLELRDLTTGETVYKARARQVQKGIGLAGVDTFASVEGLRLYKDHEYELISVYNNTSGVDQDSMAAMLIYVHAKDLHRFDFRPSAGGT